MTDEATVLDSCALFLRITSNVRRVRRALGPNRQDGSCARGSDENDSEGENECEEGGGSWRDTVEQPVWDAENPDEAQASSSQAALDTGECPLAATAEIESLTRQLREERFVVARQRAELEKLQAQNNRISAKLRRSEGQAADALENQRWAEAKVGEFAGSIDALRTQIAETKTLFQRYEANGRRIVGKQSVLVGQVKKVQAALLERLQSKMDIEEDLELQAQKTAELERELVRVRQLHNEVELDFAAFQALYHAQEKKANKEAAQNAKLQQQIETLQAECAKLVALASEQNAALEQCNRKLAMASVAVTLAPSSHSISSSALLPASQ